MGGRPAEDEHTARIGSTLQIIECATDCSPRPAPGNLRSGSVSDIVN